MWDRVRVKICGITQSEDLADAVAAGADAVGLNFYPPSPRYLHPERAVELLAGLPPMVEAVGVFVGDLVTEFLPVLNVVSRIRTMQVHGTPEVGLFFPYAWVPAFAVRDGNDVQRVRSYLQRCADNNAMPGAVLLDGHAPGLAGGTGRPAPWDLLEGLNLGVPLILAGGLTPENVAEAIRRVRPYAVDVASGVESSPGRKCRDRVRRFIESVRTTGG